MIEEKKKQLFELIVQQNKGILFKVARTYCWNEMDQQDLLQEMMIQIWRTIDRYDESFKISTWLYRICLNVAISFYRKSNNIAKHTTSLDNEVQLPNEDNGCSEDENFVMLRTFINELPELDRALMLLYLEDKKHSEISEILGISTSNVGTKIGRIKVQLSKKFSRMDRS